MHDKSSACRDLDQKVAAFPYQQINRKFHQYSRVTVNIISHRVIGNKSAKEDCVQIQAEQSITHLRTQRNYLNRFYKAQKLWQTIGEIYILIQFKTMNWKKKTGLGNFTCFEIDKTRSHLAARTAINANFLSYLRC